MRRAVPLASMLCLIGFSALAQQAAPFNRSATDQCEADANRMFQMRDLEERMRQKRDYVRRCRAEQRGAGGPGQRR